MSLQQMFTKKYMSLMFMNGIRQHWEHPLYAANLFAGIVCLITTNVTHPTISILSETKKDI